MLFYPWNCSYKAVTKVPLGKIEIVPVGSGHWFWASETRCFWVTYFALGKWLTLTDNYSTSWLVLSIFWSRTPVWGMPGPAIENILSCSPKIWVPDIIRKGGRRGLGFAASYPNLDRVSCSFDHSAMGLITLYSLIRSKSMTQWHQTLLSSVSSSVESETSAS